MFWCIICNQLSCLYHDFCFSLAIMAAVFDPRSWVWTEIVRNSALQISDPSGLLPDGSKRARGGTRNGWWWKVREFRTDGRWRFVCHRSFASDQQPSRLGVAMRRLLSHTSLLYCLMLLSHLFQVGKSMEKQETLCHDVPGSRVSWWPCPTR